MCGFRVGPQENWLFTQHISRSLRNGELFDTVSVEIDYVLQSCSVERNCLRGFELLKWETSAVDRNVAQKTANFVKVGNFSRNGSYNGSDVLTERIVVTFESEETGVYLALMDRGTCVLIYRLLVFYEGRICPGNKTGLIEHSEVLPPKERVVGKCAPSSSTLDGSDPVIRCTDEGSWEVVRPCMCLPGFKLMGNFTCTGNTVVPNIIVTLGAHAQRGLL